MAIPGIGWQPYCTGPEGNLFGIHQSGPAAV
jgi:predicted enzyme related to lactoylglutathione lyase